MSIDKPYQWIINSRNKEKFTCRNAEKSSILPCLAIGWPYVSYFGAHWWQRPIVHLHCRTQELLHLKDLRNVFRPRAARSIISSGTSSTTSDPPCEPLDEHFYMSQEFEANTLISQISHGRPFPMWYFDTKKPELIDAVPLDIDGTQFYRIKANKNEWHKVTRDLRHFNMVTSSHLFHLSSFSTFSSFATLVLFSILLGYPWGPPCRYHLCRGWLGGSTFSSFLFPCSPLWNCLLLHSEHLCLEIPLPYPPCPSSSSQVPVPQLVVYVGSQAFKFLSTGLTAPSPASLSMARFYMRIPPAAFLKQF